VHIGALRRFGRYLQLYKNQREKIMILNRQAKIGLFEKNLQNEKGLFLFDFKTKEKKYLEEYLDWKPESISPDGRKIAITINSQQTKLEKTDLVVIEHDTNTVLLNNYKYYVYDIAFDITGSKLLVVANNKKPFCLDIIKNEIIAELPKLIRLYKGDLDLQNDTFLAPCEQKKETCYLFNFKTGQTDVQKIGTKEIISRVKYSVDFTSIYVITETNILYCFDRNFKTKWSKDFNSLGRINSSEIFSTEDGNYVAVYSTSTKTNNWGAEFVINSEDGELINQIEGYQFRGRFATNYFDNKVLLHTFKTTDLLTGEVSENQII